MHRLTIRKLINGFLFEFEISRNLSYAPDGKVIVIFHKLLILVKVMKLVYRVGYLKFRGKILKFHPYMENSSLHGGVSRMSGELKIG